MIHTFLQDHNVHMLLIAHASRRRQSVAPILILVDHCFTGCNCSIENWAAILSNVDPSFGGSFFDL